MPRTKPITTKPTKAARKPKRGKGGKFAKGTAPGPGRPTRQREAEVARSECEFLRLFRKCISVDDFQRIVAAHVRSAMKGSVRSAELLFRHLLPQPTARTVIEQTLFHSFENDGGLRVAGSNGVGDFDAQFLRKMAEACESGDPVAAEFNTLVGSLFKRPDAKPYPPSPHPN